MTNTAPITPAAAASFLTTHTDQIHAELAELVSFPTVHGKTGCEDDTRRAIAWLTERIETLGMGFVVQAIETADGSVAIHAHRPAKEGKKTVLLYSHYDVVDVPDESAWETDPWVLTDVDGRWYGRGAADCKGNVIAHLFALKALDALGDDGLGITLLIEGSEEQGGEGLDHLLATRPELVKADVLLIVDTGNAALGVPTLTTSLRGGGLIEVTATTLSSPVHSGEFGGAAPDAVAALMRTIDSLRDEFGRTVIDGVDCTGKWDGAQYPVDDFRADAGVLDGVALYGDDKTDTPADAVWARPAVTVIGFSSTPVDKAVNAIPHTAQAKLNFRVPAGMDAQDVADKLVAHLFAHVPWGAHLSATITDVNEPFAATVDTPAAKLLAQALRDAYDGKETVFTGAGGSIPLTVELKKLLPHADIALFGVEEPSCKIHSVGESVHPDEILRITCAEVLFLSRLGAE